MASKGYRDLKALAARFGRRLVPTRNGHYRLVCKRGERPFVMTSATPSDVRTQKNLVAELKRHDTPKEKRP